MEINSSYGLQGIPSKIKPSNNIAHSQYINKTNKISDTYKNDLSTKNTAQIQIRTYRFLQPGEITQRPELLNGSASAERIYLLKHATDYVKGKEVHEYDLSNFTNEFSASLSESKVFGYSVSDNEYEFSIELANGRQLIRVNGQPIDKPIDPITAKKIIIKASNMIDTCNETVEEIAGFKIAHTKFNVNYDPSTKKIDFSPLLNEVNTYIKAAFHTKEKFREDTKDLNADFIIAEYKRLYDSIIEERFKIVRHSDDETSNSSSTNKKITP